MSLFQCEHCGCCENTALSSQGFFGRMPRMNDHYDWSGMEDRRGKLLCSACGPSKYSDGTKANGGKWHGRFDRTYLPMGAFKTADNGNLEHIASGDQDFMKFAIAPPEGTKQ